MSVEAIKIIRGIDGAIVDAQLHRGLRAVDLTLIERQWSPWRQDIIRRLSERGVDPAIWPQSLHWDWFAKLRYLQLLAVEVCAIDAEGEWQAIVMMETVTHRCQLAEQVGKHLVYVDYIETAPWNWPIPEFGLSRRFKGLGHILFRNVIRRSFDLGYKGRIGLVALPQAKAFYGATLGMAQIPATSPHELDYFELSEAKAMELITQEN